MVLRGYLGPTMNESLARGVCSRITEMRYAKGAAPHQVTSAIRGIVYGLECMGKTRLKNAVVKELKSHHRDVCPTYYLV